ncbi:MAG: 2-dehydro-3-deoxy-6-phosphogalactonate aldolase [Proteobacteria bacterium]|nr:2-dehydro-3-deoxy-6-phosphogalactonate aldolase [Pseudomonadota bacterium]
MTDGRNLIAILRGVTPDAVSDIGHALFDCGITRIEVPLNTHRALDSIATLVDALGDRALIGAGTVITREQVRTVAEIGGRLIVSPNFDPDVVQETRRRALVSMPGVVTPSECFAALKAGADALKLFPAFHIGPEGLAALRAVLPRGCAIYPVGGVAPEHFGQWLVAGADGFGLGGALYQPGDSAAIVGRKAARVVAQWDRATKGVEV